MQSLEITISFLDFIPKWATDETKPNEEEEVEEKIERAKYNCICGRYGMDRRTHVPSAFTLEIG